MRLGGSAVVRECSFLSNRASTRGLAVAVVGWFTNITGSSFDGNDLTCAVGSYRNDTEEVNWRGFRSIIVSLYAVRRWRFAHTCLSALCISSSGYVHASLLV